MTTLSNHRPMTEEPQHAARTLFDVALSSAPGLQRANNEDSAAVHPTGLVYLVADGMGGHERGEVAATTAARAIARMPAPPQGAQSFDVARAALGAARIAVARVPPGKRSRPGCAAVVAAFDPGGDTFSLAWAGDCRAYVFRPHEARLVMLTEDQHVDTRPNVLSNVLMSGDVDGSKDATRRPERLAPGDVLLLTSDGLHGYVSDASIRSAFLRHRTARDLCTALVGLAYVAGAPDNVTVLAVRRR